MYQYKPIIDWNNLEEVQLVNIDDPDYTKSIGNKINESKTEKEFRYRNWCDNHPEEVKKIKRVFSLQEEKNCSNCSHFNVDSYSSTHYCCWVNYPNQNLPTKYSLTELFTNKCNEHKKDSIDRTIWKCIKENFERIPPPLAKVKKRGNIYQWPAQMRKSFFKFVLGTEMEEWDWKKVENHLKNLFLNRSDCILCPNILKYKLQYEDDFLFKKIDFLVNFDDIFILLECKSFPYKTDIIQVKDYSELFIRTNYFQQEAIPLISILFTTVSSEESFFLEYLQENDYKEFNLNNTKRYPKYPVILKMYQLRED